MGIFDFIGIMLGLFVLLPIWLYLCVFMAKSGWYMADYRHYIKMNPLLKAFYERENSEKTS